jgi:hypothetical protein
LVSTNQAKAYRQRGAKIIRELLKSTEFEKYTGRKKQLAVIGVLGVMEAGKSTLFRYLNDLSDAPVKLSWDDKSLLALHQEEIDEFTKIRHYFPDERILLLAAAHRFYLYPATLRNLSTALIYVSKPPPWAYRDLKHMFLLQRKYGLKWPNRPYNGLVLWTNWVNQRTEWGWVVWEDIQDEQHWTRTDFLANVGCGVSVPEEITSEAILQNKELVYVGERRT